MIWPAPVVKPLVTIIPLSMEAGAGGSAVYNGANQGLNSHAAGNWPNSNRAIFVPFMLSQKISFSTMFTSNWNSVSGNLDVGIYSSDGTKIVSKGSTAMSGTYNIQLLTLTTTTLGPGLYYMAMSCDNTTANFAIQQIGQSLKTPYTGLAQMDSAFPLPASATFATLGQDQIPLFGLSTRSTI